MSIINELIIGTSDSLNLIRYIAEQIADANSTVLISGESGTGKSLMAQAIYQLSDRHHETLFQFDCAATSQKYLERELFGFEERAFPEANRSKKGLLESANGCTVLLENIDQSPIQLQTRLLQVFVDRSFSPLDSKQVISTNCRFLVTSKLDMKERVKARIFRDDFYYRLKVIPIRMPALREISEDLEALICNFIARLGKDPTTFLAMLKKHGLLSYMQNYSWPGNMKELKHIVESLVLTEAWDKTKQLLLGHGYASNQLVLERRIEFPPEYHQAGISIMSFFGEVLRRKYPNHKATVRIEQDGLKVRMIVEPVIGESAIFERALDEYGLVLTRQITIEEFTNDPFLTISLKNELRMAHVRIESQKELLNYQNIQLREKDRQVEQLMGLISQSIHAQKQQSLYIDISPTISPAITVGFNLSISLDHIFKSLERLSEMMKHSGKESETIEKISKELKELDNRDANCVKESPVMAKLHKLIERISDTETKIGKTIKRVRQGVTTIQKLAKDYNDIAQWCGLPQIPRPFLGSKGG